MSRPPRTSEPDRFTATVMTEGAINHLAATYCDTCPARAECYRSALRDDSAWGVYGGVMFANGQPVEAAKAMWRRPSRKSIPMLRDAA